MHVTTHAKMSNLKQSDHPTFQDLKLKGIGGSLTGDKFSAIHGDLMTELFNRETKGTSGPFRCGFSADIDGVNTWVNTIHINALLRKRLHEVVHMKPFKGQRNYTSRQATALSTCQKFEN